MHPRRALALALTLVTSSPLVLAWDSTIHSVVAPTERSSVTKSDAWQCLTENASQYFQVPRPTGALSSTLKAYINLAMAPCLSTVDPLNRFYGCFPGKETWCNFATAMPKEVAADWSSLGSAASSFWAAKSSSARELAYRCPLRWYDSSVGVLGGAALLNQTIILGACYVEANPTGPGTGGGSSTSTSSRVGPSKTSTSSATTRSPTTSGSQPGQSGTVPAPGQTHGDVNPKCNKWHLVESGQRCAHVVQQYSITLSKL